MKLTIVAALLFWPLTATAQFACTLSGASDEDSCFAATGDNGDPCSWCEFSKFGFCVDQCVAEALEKFIPSVQCDQSPNPPGDDDQAPATDDQAPPTDDQAPATDDQAPPAEDDQVPPASDDQAPPATDDQAPPTDDKAPPVPTDDKITPSDDKIPSNYWACLEQKDSTTCAAMEGCTWCKTKAGFGLCLTGPSAESASDSTWFDCKAVDEALVVPEEKAPQDPMDTTCVMAFLQDPTEDGCKAAVDSDGGACLWCDLAGTTNLCLTAEQAQMAQIIGVTCEEVSVKISLRGA